jgi:hypothetical protein
VRSPSPSRGLASRCAFVSIIFAAGLLLPALPASAATLLPLPTFAEIAVDTQGEHVFVSGGSGSTSIVVLDYAGNIVTTIDSMPGATGMVVYQGLLYVALRDGAAIGRVSLAGLNALPPLELTGVTGRPTFITVAGDRLWFSVCDSNDGTFGMLASMGTDGSALRTYTDQGYPIFCTDVASSSDGSGSLFAADATVGPATLYKISFKKGNVKSVSSVRDPGVQGTDSVDDMVVTPDGSQVLIAAGYPYFLEAFSANTLNSVGTYPTGPYPTAIAVSRDGSKVAAGLWALYDPDAYVFPFRKQSPSLAYDFGEGLRVPPRAIAFDGTGTKLFVVTTTSSPWGAYPTLNILNV